MGGPRNGSRLRRRFHGQRWINERQLVGIACIAGSHSQLNGSNLERIKAMTNSTTVSRQKISGRQSVLATSDHAPMVVTRLSGWIGSNEAKTRMAAWIVPTRVA